MTLPGSHPGDALQLLLDDRLPPEQRSAVEAHLRDCARCRAEIEGLRRVRTLLRESLPEPAVPPDVASRIAATLGREADRAPRPRRLRGARRLVPLGVALAAATALLLVVRPGQPDFVAAAADDFARDGAAGLALEVETDDARALERFFHAGRVPFPARVFDFGAMQYRLRGGRVHRLAGRISALFAYTGEGGRRLVCQMYQGATAELPPPAEAVERDGIRFLIYHSHGVTLVFWQEGPVVCVLVTDAAAADAVALAAAKAQKA